MSEEVKEKQDRLQDLYPVLEEYTEWFAKLVRCLQYPELYEETSQHLKEPKQFLIWTEKVKGDSFINEITLSDMKTLYDNIHNTASNLLSRVSVAGAERISLNEFDELVGFYDNFIIRLHSLERACYELDSGKDGLSGLKNEEAMRHDVAVELERRARRGNPFCLVLASIDRYDEIKEKLSEEDFTKAIAAVGRQILKCVRTFDDAFRLQSGEFIMSLKHTGTIGGTAAINRLRRMVEGEDIVIAEGSKDEFHLTMSYCLSEPLPGDTVDDLLSFMRTDLKKYGDEGDAAVEYVDKSPLARYIAKDS